ncbi:hypothetical protein ACFSSA_00610 [Luteolibacter algae]|uniref:Serine protease n=1 Tax=Luteolibacter algae TaxID=454151 RepID=A0ABW5D2Z7_9BACT
MKIKSHYCRSLVLSIPLWLGAMISCASQASLPSPSLPAPKAPPQIFSEYSADRDATMAGGWTRGMDMSGVAFDDTRTATLITPRHVVMAKHYSRNVGDAVIFHDRNGRRAVRRIQALMATSSDIMVGLLNEPLPAAYHSYALPSVSPNTADLVDRPVIVSDQKRSLFIHLISSIHGGTIAFKQDESDRYGWGKNLVVGDSGNPSFMISGGELVLLETHTYGGAGSGPFYGAASVQTEIREAITKLDPGYRIRTVRIP